jgi:SAM-dependent methyltransferase
MTPNQTENALPTIESIKKYWDNQPCNVNHSKKLIGSKEYFDEVEIKKYFVEPHILKFADFSSWTSKKVLEIGCGIGTDAINFARSGASYFGIDISPKSIALTKKRFDVFNLSGNLVCGDAENLDFFFKDDNFDLVYSFGVIHHTPNPKVVIEQAYKLLKPGGELRIMLYNKRSWKAFMIQCGLDQFEAQSGCPLAFTYDYDDCNSLLTPQFTILSIDTAHIFPYQISEYKKNVYVREPWFNSMPEIMFNKLENELGWHILIRAIKCA